MASAFSPTNIHSAGAKNHLNHRLTINQSRVDMQFTCGPVYKWFSPPTVRLPSHALNYSTDIVYIHVSEEPGVCTLLN